ncbi:MAG: hypothetical protein WBE58_13280 [Verrucomicrobiales bacterium]
MKSSSLNLRFSAAPHTLARSVSLDHTQVSTKKNNPAFGGDCLTGPLMTQ